MGGRVALLTTHTAARNFSLKVFLKALLALHPAAQNLALELFSAMNSESSNNSIPIDAGIGRGLLRGSADCPDWIIEAAERFQLEEDGTLSFRIKAVVMGNKRVHGVITNVEE